MDHRGRLLVACAAIVGIFLVVQAGALAFVEPAQEQGLQEFEDGGDPSLSIGFFAAILVATGLMLLALKYGGQAVLRAFIILASVYISFVVFDVATAALLSSALGEMGAAAVAIAAALAIGAALAVYPEWYVIDAAGIVMGIGAAGLFGLNLGILPVLVLLVVLAVYDAISVYGTKHMLTLASGVMEMRVPVVLVVPLSLSYSFLESETPEALRENSNEVSTDSDRPDSERPHSEGAESERVANERDDTERADDGVEPLTAAELESLGPAGIAQLDEHRLETLTQAELDAVDDEIRDAVREVLPRRDAMFIGLGDAIIPTVLVASAAVFVETGPSVTLIGVSAPIAAITAMGGTIAGLVVLLWLVTRGRAHAGLPLLNGGAIAGYLLGALLSGLTLAEALGISSVL